MPIPSQTAGLVYLKDLRIGLDELLWGQDERHRVERFGLLGELARSGLIIRRGYGGDLSDEWQVVDDDDDGKVSILVGPQSPYTAPGYALAVDPEGYVFALESEAANVVTLPNDATWYTLVVERTTTLYERGTLQVALGSAVVIGTGTEFSRFSGKTTSGFGRGSRIYIKDSTGGNNGTYEIDTITDDTHLTLTETVAGANESGLAFAIAGKFDVAAPADPQIHERVVPSFSAVARTRDATSPALILADVKRDDLGSPKVTIIDRRHANLYRRVDNVGAGLDIRATLTFATGAPYTAANLNRSNALAVGGTSFDGTAIAPSVSNGMLAAIHNATTGAIRARLYTPSVAAAVADWGDPGGAGTVNIDATGTATEPTIVQLPRNSGHTHVCVYHDTGDTTLKARFTTDDGVTWTAATTILSPTSVNASNLTERPAGILLQNGRLVIACGYFDKTLNGGAGQWTIRYVYSDDYGATWQTNANSAFSIVTVILPGARDARRPAITQNAWGQVFTAYEYSAVGTDGGTIRVYPGGINTPVPALTDTQGGLALNGVATKQLGPCMWASEHAIAVIYTGWVNGAYLAISCAIVQTKQDGAGNVSAAVQNAHELFRVESGAVAQEQLWPSVCQGRGDLNLLFKDSNPADTTAIWVPLLPVTVARRGQYLE